MIELNMAKFNVKNPQTGEYEPLDGASQAKVQSDWNQTDNSAEDFIKNKPAVYTKTQTDTLIDRKVDKETGKGLSTNDYTAEEKNKLAGIASGAEVNVQSDWSQSDSSADDYIKNKPTIPTVNDATLTIQKNGTAVGTFSANAATAATINVTVPVNAEDVDALPDTTKYGASLSLSIDSSTYVVTASLKDQDGNTLGTAQTIDLPLETVVVGGSYDDTTKKVILTLKNGTTVDFSVADLVAGLQTEITSTNKLDADLVDDTTSVHKFVTAADKSTWNAKSDFSGSYNDLTDKPTIPAAQVNADWNATSGAAQILNKPDIYTKSEIDAALAEKLDTADVDEDMSSTSTNPVQNKAIQAPLAVLVDKGAKNLVINFGQIEHNGCIFTYDSDGRITVTGTKSTALAMAEFISNQNLSNYGLSAGDKIVAVSDNENVGLEIIFVNDQGTADPSISIYNEIRTITIPSGRTRWYLRLQIKPDIRGTINESTKPMVCDKKLYDIDPTVTPYAKSNYELTQDVEPIPSLVDRGAKNIIDIMHPSNSRLQSITDNLDGTYTLSGSGTWLAWDVDCNVINGNRYKFVCDFSSVSTDGRGLVVAKGVNNVDIFRENVNTSKVVEKEFTANGNSVIIGFTVNNGATTGSGSFTMNPMLCTAEDYAISPEFVPYAPTNRELYTALSGKQSTLTAAQQSAIDSGITASIVNKTSALINGLYMVASVAGGNGNQSLEYTVNRSDFNTMSGSGVDYTGTYLIHCIEWASEGKPYIGLITFSGGQYSKLTKTDVVTGYVPTITIDGNKFTISRAARISVYALR